MIKQILIVRKDLNMRKGKISAQCAHASMKVFFDLADAEVTKKGATLTIPLNKEMYEWYSSGFAKICVYVNSEQELEEVYQKAKKANLPAAMIVDSGKTEFHGVPTKTVVAIGPADSSKIDPITGHLPLL